MQTKLATLRFLASALLRNKYALLAIVVLGTVGPGIVRLSAALRALQH
jgi:hypothetical protein